MEKNSKQIDPETREKMRKSGVKPDAESAGKLPREVVEKLTGGGKE